MIVIVDYGLGNLRSILQKFEMLAIEAKVSSELKDIIGAKKLILPGVGHFAEGMRNLNSSGLLPILNDQVLAQKKPILGICLGMQLFTNFSEEGNVKGLGWISAQTRRFNFSSPNQHLRIPHVGWNTLETKRSALFEDIDPDKRYYFTHSYYVTCEDDGQALASTNYGGYFHSAIRRDNIYGTQFHPEKSHHHGLRLIKNFVELCD